MQAQVDLVRSTGNQPTIDESELHLAAVLFEGDAGPLLELSGRISKRGGPIVPVYVPPYPLEFLFDEISLSINTAAAGGNASLMTIG